MINVMKIKEVIEAICFVVFHIHASSAFRTSLVFEAKEKNW